MVFLIGVIWRAVPAAADAATVERGKEIYEREKCAMCHSIAGKGNRRYPLDGVGSRLDGEEIRKWIVSPEQMKPGIKKKSYQLPQQDMEALVDYLSSLKE